MFDKSLIECTAYTHLIQVVVLMMMMMKMMMMCLSNNTSNKRLGADFPRIGVEAAEDRTKQKKQQRRQHVDSTWANKIPNIKNRNNNQPFLESAISYELEMDNLRFCARLSPQAIRKLIFGRDRTGRCCPP